MKAIYECEWCSFLGTAEVVEYHERNCKYNPKNIKIEEKEVGYRIIVLIVSCESKIMNPILVVS